MAFAEIASCEACSWHLLRSWYVVDPFWRWSLLVYEKYQSFFRTTQRLIDQFASRNLTCLSVLTSFSSGLNQWGTTTVRFIDRSRGWRRAFWNWCFKCQMHCTDSAASPKEEKQRGRIRCCEDVKRSSVLYSQILDEKLHHITYGVCSTYPYIFDLLSLEKKHIVLYNVKLILIHLYSQCLKTT